MSRPDTFNILTYKTDTSTSFQMTAKNFLFIQPHFSSSCGTNFHFVPLASQCTKYTVLIARLFLAFYIKILISKGCENAVQ